MKRRPGEDGVQWCLLFVANTQMTPWLISCLYDDSFRIIALEYYTDIAKSWHCQIQMTVDSSCAQM